MRLFLMFLFIVPSVSQGAGPEECDFHGVGGVVLKWVYEGGAGYYTVVGKQRRQVPILRYCAETSRQLLDKDGNPQPINGDLQQRVSGLSCSATATGKQVVYYENEISYVQGSGQTLALTTWYYNCKKGCNSPGIPEQLELVCQGD